MKKVFLSFAVAGVVFAACKKDVKTTGEEGLGLNAAVTAFVDTVTLPQVINANRSLTADTLYLLNNKVFVTGGTLTIAAGTHIEGVFKPVADSASALIITKTGKISAKGSQANPIIFTSHLVGLPGGRTNRLPGDWGGIVMLGNAPTNKPTTQFIEGINPAVVPVGVDVTYGGSNVDHNGGVIVYARVEFAGAAIAPNNELNSFTFGGVGKKTALRFLMASYGADDAFEFFGGNVPAKYLIANAQNDDAFDFDFGYTGDIQFALSVRNPALPYTDANGFEVDNENPSAGSTPTTRPLLSNFTIIGSGAGAALPGTLNAGRFRRGTDLRLRNSIFMGYATGLRFENTLAANTPAFFRNNIVHAYTDSAIFTAPPTLGPWGIQNRAIVGAIPTNVINTENPATHAGWKSSAAVYQNGGQADPAVATAIKPNFVGLTTNFLSVPYIGALGPGSPIKDGNGTVIAPNNWVAGAAGAWTNFDPQ